MTRPGVLEERPYCIQEQDAVCNGVTRYIAQGVPTTPSDGRDPRSSLWPVRAMPANQQMPRHAIQTRRFVPLTSR